MNKSLRDNMSLEEAIQYREYFSSEEICEKQIEKLDDYDAGYQKGYDKGYSDGEIEKWPPEIET